MLRNRLAVMARVACKPRMVDRIRDRRLHARDHLCCPPTCLDTGGCKLVFRDKDDRDPQLESWPRRG